MHSRESHHDVIPGRTVFAAVMIDATVSNIAACEEPLSDMDADADDVLVGAKMVTFRSITCNTTISREHISCTSLTWISIAGACHRGIDSTIAQLLPLPYLSAGRAKKRRRRASLKNNVQKRKSPHAAHLYHTRQGRVRCQISAHPATHTP